MQKYIPKILITSIAVIGILFAYNVSADSCLSMVGNINLYSSNTSTAINLGKAVQWCASKTQTTCDNAQASPGGQDPVQPVCRWNATTLSGCENGALYNIITGASCSTSSASSGNTSSGNTSSVSNLSVSTVDASDITQTSAILHGIGGTNITYPPGCSSFVGYSTTIGGLLCNSGSGNSSLISPITAYFRYSKAAISPIFCNDIYGTNMISTKDIKLESSFKNDDQGYDQNSNSFYQNITNLSPNTTYYYCAILSNKENIAYGGSEIVKEFHTNCYDTTVETNPATSIKSSSATLNGSYCSAKTATTSFEYKVAPMYGSRGGDWTTVKGSEKTYDIGNYSSLYGNIKFNLSGLNPNTKYQFKAVVKNSSGTFDGLPITFTTNPGLGEKTSGGGSKDTTTPTATTTTSSGVNAPTITLFANPASVASGNSSTLTWSSTNATSCAGNGTPSFSFQTSQTAGPFSISTGNLTSSVTYTVTCTGPGGTATKRITIIVSSNNGVCTYGGTYPNCTIPPTNETSDNESAVWTTDNDGTSGTWGTGIGSGTWIATIGTGGTGIVTWAGTGNGSGTWISSTGSGTWTTTSGTGETGTGTWTNLALGQTSTPPNDAIVRYHEGIETVFTRQIIRNSLFAKTYGYQEGTNLQTFAEDLSHVFAKAFGYIDSNGKEIRVSYPDVAAYQLQLIGNRLTVYEYFANKIVDIRNLTTVFKNASDYEYYFQK